MWIKDFLMKPTKLPYDFNKWEKLPFPERAKKVCQAWAMQGFGAPKFTVLFYSLKTVLYIWLWIVFCSYSTDLGDFDTIGEWGFKLQALGKALTLTLFIEVIGFGGGSGPLTGRYMPILGGITYWLIPGTVKSPFFRILGDKRNILDIALYAALLYFLIMACIAPVITAEVIIPILILLPILGLLDTQIFLASRADVWYPALFVFLFPHEEGGALQICWFAIWFWAAFSKLTPTFTSVVAVMISNSPFMNFRWLKKKLFKSYPKDLRLSKTATYIAHFGTVIEFALPILLMTGTLMDWPKELMLCSLIGMTAFHAFIYMNFPMGVPMEWNVLMVYGGWLLFGSTSDFSPTDVNSTVLILVFTVWFLFFTLLGNFFPKYISFLLSMRYYAGTWPYSVWLFKDGTKISKLDANIRKTSPDIRKQLGFFYDEKTTNSILSRMIAFRMMHLPGRALQDLIPKAVNNIEDYYWVEGEFIAGEILGWNFGDGHLHQEQLLESVQKRANFESGELRVIMVESPRLHNGRMHWRIHDAKDGLMEEDYVYVKDLKEKMPWPTDWK